MTRSRGVLSAVIWCIIVGLSAQALAQEGTFIPDDALKNTGRPEGWKLHMALSGTTSLIDNRNMLSQPEGTTVSVGFNLVFDWGLNRGPHEWRNAFILTEAATRTPSIDEFIKSGDVLSLDSIYLYHILPWVGPFGRVSLSTHIFSTSDVRSETATYLIHNLDDTVEALLADRLLLSDPLLPLTLKESLGIFLRPLDWRPLSFEFRVAMGGLQAFADKQLVLEDDEETDEVEVKVLDTFAQVGPEVVLVFWGNIYANRVGYKFGAEVLMPFYHTDLSSGDDRAFYELTNVELFANISFKLVDWASLEYQFKAVRQPQLLDAFQIQNNLLLTISFAYTYFSEPQVLPPVMPIRQVSPGTLTPVEVKPIGM